MKAADAIEALQRRVGELEEERGELVTQIVIQKNELKISHQREDAQGKERDKALKAETYLTELLWKTESERDALSAERDEARAHNDKLQAALRCVVEQTSSVDVAYHLAEAALTQDNGHE